MSIGLFAVAVLLCVAGVVDERIAPLWNPVILAAAAIGLVYPEPRPPLWLVTSAGAALGVAYGLLVLAADALSGLHIHLAPAAVLVRAVAIGLVPALAGGVLLRWSAPATPGRRAG